MNEIRNGGTILINNGINLKNMLPILVEKDQEYPIKS
jgi:hypothetical protein